LSPGRQSAARRTPTRWPRAPRGGAALLNGAAMASAGSSGPRRSPNSFSRRTRSQVRRVGATGSATGRRCLPYVAPGMSRVSASTGHDFLRPIGGGAVRQLDIEEQIAIVLLRDEPGRSADELEVGQNQQAAVTSRATRLPRSKPPTSTVHRSCPCEGTCLKRRKNQPSAMPEPGERIAAGPGAA